MTLSWPPARPVSSPPLDGADGNAVLEICTADYGEVLVAIDLQKPSCAEGGDVVTMLDVFLQLTSGPKFKWMSGFGSD
jgi:hypothetical protein